MGEFFSSLFNNEYMPHGYCFLWQPGLVWLHAISDLVIALAYISIPITIGYLIYKRTKNIPFQWLLTLFALFIFLCGLTHLLELIGIWKAYYYFEGVIKLFTAAVSIATAILIFPLMPAILNKLQEYEDTIKENKNKHESGQK